MNLIGNARLTWFKEGWAGSQKTEARRQKSEEKIRKVLIDEQKD
jgi:hypothetical protein